MAKKRARRRKSRSYDVFGDPEPREPRKWHRVVFADLLPLCPDCSEPYCQIHRKHYADCSCIGSTEENVEYKTRGGILYGRRKDGGTAEDA